MFYHLNVKSQLSKNWGSHKNAITELFQWNPMIRGHDHILWKANAKSCRHNLSPLYPEEVNFKLIKSQLDAIVKLKLLVTTTPCMKIFTSNLQNRLKIDASSQGSGALLENNLRILIYPKWFHVGYAPWSLWYYEKRYGQIKNLTLSIDFGVERFHEYLYGHKFTVINDRQPLKPIFVRPSLVFCLVFRSFFHIYEKVNLIWNTHLEQQCYFWMLSVEHTLKM